ncbi:FAD-dependent monooxygenase [Spongiactinospora sp. TRM90649]|uniref:FAD-dependent monooxygenase n=1 Tax=Spongiactinospora sp. TRM90649 TaxID=3031114 RepID=UPI0023F743FC|nr:FAD-dependent monooxygenase [Spongiactinospora sp. TRM90649]MDF5753666.1 FAD-dependent monooxygenase [Spongiactinospora sp. TRM90649]
MNTTRISILIVGAGYAGLSAAALLAWHGVPVTHAVRHGRPDAGGQEVTGILFRS